MRRSPYQLLTVNSKGFTLVEILLVVAIIAILAAIVVIAVNPARQLAQARNTQRSVDVNTILNAVYQHLIDNRGNLIAEITTSPKEICFTSGVSSTSCGVVLADLEALTVSERYLSQIPVDPSGATTTFGTGYQIYKSANGRVTVRAPGAEIGSTTISVTR